MTAGLLAGKAPGESVGRPSADQVEIARLTRELEVTRAKLSRTQTALEIMGKRASSWRRSPGASRTPRTSLGADDPDEHLPGADRGRDSDPDRVTVDRIARATIDRDAAHPTPLLPQRQTPANTLTAQEVTRVLAVLDGPEFVDAAPAQAYARLLDQGVYVGSISTMYRILREHAQVKERRRLAKHPARRPRTARRPGRRLDRNRHPAPRAADPRPRTP